MLNGLLQFVHLCFLFLGSLVSLSNFPSRDSFIYCVWDGGMLVRLMPLPNLPHDFNDSPTLFDVCICKFLLQKSKPSYAGLTEIIYRISCQHGQGTTGLLSGCGRIQRILCITSRIQFFRFAKCSTVSFERRKEVPLHSL